MNIGAGTAAGKLPEAARNYHPAQPERCPPPGSKGPWVAAGVATVATATAFTAEDCFA